MLAEFKYGLEPKESFSYFDQSKSNRYASLVEQINCPLISFLGFSII